MSEKLGHMIELLTPQGTVKFTPTAFGGHCFYVRRCVVGDKFANDFKERVVKGVVLPQQATIHQGIFTTERNLWDRTNVAEVVGKGPNVGRPCTKQHMHKFKRARCLGDDVSVGDLLLFADENWNIGILDSPYADYEKFVEESVPLAIYQQPQGA